jgi:hypothetical protein
LHVRGSVVGNGTTLIDCTEPALSNQFTHLEKDCIFGIICRILQQSYGDSDGNRQSQTAFSSFDVLYWNICISDAIILTYSHPAVKV